MCHSLRIEAVSIVQVVDSFVGEDDDGSEDGCWREDLDSTLFSALRASSSVRDVLAGIKVAALTTERMATM